MAVNFDPSRDLDRVAGALMDIRGPRLMPMDLYREGDVYVLSADLPGIDPGSVDIDMDGQLLTIREREMDHPGAPFRDVPAPVDLGKGIDTERINATYANGVLRGGRSDREGRVRR